MHPLLTQASDALSRNDADALEQLCTSIPGVEAPATEAERVAYLNALLVFQRQVLAARSNLVLRQRLLAAHHPAGAAPWAP